MVNRFPELVYYYPTDSDAPVQSLIPSIVLGWSQDIDLSQFQNPTILPSRITLAEDATGKNVPLVYVSYDPTKKSVTLQPTSPLSYNTKYRLLVKAGVEDINRRKLPVNRNIWFTTANSTIGTPTLFTPTNYSTQTSFPNFTWSGAGTFEIQVSSDPVFSSTLDDHVLTFGSSPTFLPSTPYALNTTYYWRVRSISGAVSGNWSPIGSFYYGNQVPADLTSAVNPTVASFHIVTTTLDDWNTNLNQFPTLTFTFSEPLVAGDENKISIVTESVSPRLDINNDYQEKPFTGSWSINGSDYTYNPTSTLTLNTRYIFRFPISIQGATTGGRLRVKEQYWFTSSYSPYYCPLSSVKARLGAAAATLSDDLINYFIHMQSLQANALYATSLAPPYLVIGPEGIQEQAIRNWGLKSHSVMRWTLASTLCEIVNRLLMDDIKNLGRSVKLSDYSESLNMDYVKGLKVLLETCQQEKDIWSSDIIGTPGSATPMRNPEYGGMDYYSVWDYGKGQRGL